MRILGLTGGVGAGKSLVLEYLKNAYGATVLELDRVAQALQRPGEVCFEPMVKLLGTDVLKEDGQFDRARISEQVFSNPALLKKLNAIVHPAVKQRVLAVINEEREKEESLPGKPSKGFHLIVLEAALLLEDHYDEICDEIWYIYADEAVRLKRLKENRGYSPKRIAHMMESQQPDSYYRKRCQLVINNSGCPAKETYRQIDEGLKENGFL